METELRRENSFVQVHRINSKQAMYMGRAKSRHVSIPLVYFVCEGLTCERKRFLFIVCQLEFVIFCLSCE